MKTEKETQIMPFTDIYGREIYYEIHGDGDPIVLPHHGFGCTQMWKDIYPPLVDNGYQVIMYDRRGYGSSDGGNDFKKFYVSDTFRSESVKELDQLMDFLSITSFYLIGQCKGGVIAIDYAVQCPDRIKTVITSSTQCYSKAPMGISLKNMSAMSLIFSKGIKFDDSFCKGKPDHE